MAAHKSAFLAAFRQCGNVTTAAAVAGVERRSHYRWMQEDEAYRAEFEQDVREEAADGIEARLRELAVDGVVKYKHTRDGTPLRHPVTDEPYFEREYNVTAAIFLLKGLRPGVYADRHEHTGKNGAPIKVEHSTVDPYKHLTEEELDQAEALLRAGHERALAAAEPTT